MSHRTILGYVGGKFYAVKKLARYFPAGLTEMGSPFLGGGSLEVYMAAKGVRVVAADLIEELVVFWQEVLRDGRAVAEMFASYVPIEYPLEGYRQRLLGGQVESRVEQAVLLYILVQCGFSKILNRTGGAPRTVALLNGGQWRSRYAALARFSAPNLSVECLDCFDFMERYPGLVLYCDPPYANRSQDLYGFGQNLHGGFDHERLRDVLMAREAPWVLSYGDCERVRELYRGCVMDRETWFHGSSGMPGRELVIRPPGSEARNAVGMGHVFRETHGVRLRQQVLSRL